ncbi:MAG: hypothetical protein ACXWIN_00340 [Burkholderiaceae bacterium]
MANNRDNFTAKVGRTLERRVNGHCSRPGCGVPTSGPNSDPDKASSMGIAAHICAAAPGGPRYDPGMTPLQRAGSANGIWLCANCSILIDRDETEFTVALLQAWKTQAEKKADQDLGKTPVSRHDYELLQNIVLGDFPKKRIANAVADICRLSAEAIEKIDPRFSVDISHQDGQTSYVLNAKEPVNGQVHVGIDFQSEFRDKLNGLIHHGDVFEMEGHALTLTGSPLFDLNDSKISKLVIKNNLSKLAVLKLSVHKNNGDLDFCLDDVVGFLTGGTKSITYKGKVFNGLLGFEFRYELNSTSADNNQMITTHLNLTSWENKSVRALPYFEKMYKWFEALFRQTNLTIALEIEGDPIFSATSNSLMSESDAQDLYAMFRYIRNVRAIMQLLRIDIPFRSDFIAGPDEVRWTEQVYTLLFDYKKLRGKDIPNMNFQISPFDSPDAEEHIRASLSGEARAMKIEQTLDQPFKAFGREISILRLVIHYSAATLSLTSIIPQIKPGKFIPMTMQPAENCVVDVAIID